MKNCRSKVDTKPAKRRLAYDLGALINRITKLNRHSETYTGPSIGREKVFYRK